ncbi:MAG TPA: hypothetical protein VJZ27_15690 [Aggregatilineales bacterium]|nr:hypothetical protein [Aggregatilineales bacterium]
MVDNTSHIIDIPSRDTRGEVALGHGVSLEWVNEGRIAVFRMGKPTREAVDLFVDVQIAVIKQWNDTEPFAFVSDGTHPDFSMTPYMRNRFPDIGNTMSDKSMRSYAVVLLRKNLVGTMILYFGNRFHRKAGDMDLKYLSSLDEALEWLGEKIASTR